MSDFDFQPLSGIRSLTLATNVPGPVAAARLRALGAKVVKVEPPGGDPLSRISPAWYESLTQDQQIVRLNLKEPDQRAQLDQLLETSDLLVTATRSAALDRLSLGWSQMHARFPRLSHVAIVGHQPPNEDKAGHDATYQAELGLIAPPQLPRTLLADLAGAERVVSAAVTLLFKRERNGVGGYARVSLVEAASIFADPLRYGVTTQGGPLGGALPRYNIYRTLDGWVVLAALESHFWERLQGEIGLCEPTQEELGRVFLTRRSGDWEEWADARDLPLVPLAEALAESSRDVSKKSLRVVRSTRSLDKTDAPLSESVRPGTDMEKFETPYVAITDAIASHAKWRPDRTALVCGDQRVTWREFNQAIDRVANGLLKGGLRKGNKVSVLMLNSIEMLEIMMGTIKAGGVIVPLSVMLTAESLATMINDSDSRFILVGAPFARVIDSIRRDLLNISSEGYFVLGEKTEGWIDYQRWRDEFADRAPQVRLIPEDDFNLIYSSGTTGTPKGIAHTHYARQQTAYILAVEFRFDLNSIAVVTTPLFANGTWIMMLPSLTIGSTLVIMPQFDPKKFLDIVERERATHTFMVPTQYIVTMDVPEFDRFDLSSLKTLLSAGAPLRADTKAQMLQQFGGGVFELYGLTEGIATRLRPEDMESKLSSVGTTIFGGDIRIIDDAGDEVPRGEAGEIVGYSSALMRGYYKKPAETAAAVWKDEAGRTYLRTGDIGKLDEDGFLYILDRKKDMILSGGVNVFPKDIEEILTRHPEVADAAVIGVPHDKWGETPLALVIRRPGSSLTAEELTAWANERLAKHQRIAGVEFCNELPRNALGKVLKKQLREPYWRNKA